MNKIKKEIQPETILNFEKDDTVQVSNIKGSHAIKKYLSEKGITIKSVINIVEINKHILILVVNGKEVVLSVDDAAEIMVTKASF